MRATYYVEQKLSLPTVSEAQQGVNAADEYTLPDPDVIDAIVPQAICNNYSCLSTC